MPTREPPMIHFLPYARIVPFGTLSGYLRPWTLDPGRIWKTRGFSRFWKPRKGTLWESRKVPCGNTSPMVVLSTIGSENHSYSTRLNGEGRTPLGRRRVTFREAPLPKIGRFRLALPKIGRFQIDPPHHRSPGPYQKLPAAHHLRMVLIYNSHFICYPTSHMDEANLELAYLDPWDRQPDEKAKPWSAFVAYRDMGYARTYKKVAEKIGVTPASIYSYAKKHKWPERVQAYDIYQDRVFQAEKAQALKDMAFRQAKLTNDAIEAIMKPIDAMLTRAQDPDFAAELMRVDWDDLMTHVQRSSRVLKQLFAAERTALGAPSEITEVQGTVQHEVKHQVEDDDLATIAELFNRHILPDGSGEGEAEEIIDAEVVEVQYDDTAS